MAGKSYTVTAVFEAVDKVTKTLAGIERAVTKVGVSTKNVERISKGARTAFSGMGDVLKGVGNLALGAARGVGAVGGAVLRAIPGTRAIGRAFERAGTVIRYSVATGIETASAKIRGFVSNMAPLQGLFASNSAIGRAGAMFKRFGATVSSVARPLVTGLGQIAGGFGKIVGGAAGMARGVLGAMGNVGKAIVGTLGNAVVKAGSIGATIAGKIGGAIQGAIPHLQAAGNVALKAFGVIGAAATAAGLALLSFTTSAASLQNVQAAFDGIATASGRSGNEVLAALEKGSAGMVSQRDLMLTYNKAAQLVSKDFANQLPDAMQYVGKVAAATGQDMGFLMDSLVVGVGRLSPAILDNLSIQVSLEEATARAAKMFGVQADSLTKAQQQAGMMAVVTEKLAANTAAMPEVAGTAAAQLAEMSAQIQNAKDQAGLAFIPVLQALLPLFLGLLTRVQGLVPHLQRFGEVLAILINYVKGGGDVFQGLSTALLMLGVPPGVVAAFDAFVAKLREFGGLIQQVVAWAAPYVAMVAGWIGQNVKLQDVLTAVGAVIMAALLPAIGAIAGPIAMAIAVIAAVTAIVALLRTAWEENWGGIQQKAAAVGEWLQTNIPLAFQAIVAFWEGTLRPALQDLIAWLSTNVPAAITVLQGFWENTLLPAITNVWSFIQTNLVPLFESLGNLLSAVVGVAVTALAGLWENVLLPALKTAGAWIQDTFGPILEKFGEWLGNVTGGVDGISTAFQNAIKWIQDLADKIGSLSLPDWLTPGSPTPFEIGLRGIGSAARQLARTEFPQLGGSLTALPARDPLGTQARSVDNRQEIGEINVYGAQDDEALVNRLTWRLRRQRVYGGA